MIVETPIVKCPRCGDENQAHKLCIVHFPDGAQCIGCTGRDMYAAGVRHNWPKRWWEFWK